MALKIKKVILNDKGQVVEELEGTEAEIEAYERKRSKKQESAKSKKGLLLGKEMLAQIQKMIDDAIRTSESSVPKQPKQIIEHHWCHSNGWWWKPAWHNDHYIYMATNTDPSQVSSVSYITCNSSAELGSKIGVQSNHIDAQLIGANNIGGVASVWSGNACAVGADLSKNVYTATAGAPVGYPINNATSGMINLNMKS